MNSMFVEFGGLHLGALLACKSVELSKKCDVYYTSHVFDELTWVMNLTYIHVRMMLHIAVR